MIRKFIGMALYGVVRISFYVAVQAFVFRGKDLSPLFYFDYMML